MTRQDKGDIMKKSILLFLGAAVAMGVGFYITKPEPENAPTRPESQQAKASAGEPLESAPSAPQPDPLPPPPIAKPIASVTGRANQVVDAAFLGQAVDVLVSRQATRQQRQDIWKQLRDAGKLDQVITELEQRITNDAQTAEYPAALGEAYLKKCGTIRDMREQGILAMEADKLFDTALTLDPSNWDARFTKAVGMSYWPPVLNKGEEVIQNFETLIQQQEARTPQPHFAETYAWLGDQYQKSGRVDDARAIWQRGASLFPADERLRIKLASPQ